jgi:thiol-disulfide isomerase/thioredoxin
MRAFAPFAVFCLSAATAGAATLVEAREPAKIAAAFAPRAAIRVVNVWATWCVPCVEEMSDLHAVETAFGPEVSIVGVSLDDMIPGDRLEIRRKVVAFLEGKGIRFPNIYYKGTNDALADYLHFNGEIPLTVMFDRSGRELWRQQGRLDRLKMVAEIRKFLRRHR